MRGIPEQGLISHPRRRLNAVRAGLLAAVVGVWSCASPQPGPSSQSRPAWQDAHPRLLEENVFQVDRSHTLDRQGLGAAPGTALQVYYEVWRFRVAGQDFGASDRLWDHLDESLLAHERGVLLRRNGIRVGVGRESSWPAVREIIVQNQPRVWRTEGAVAQGEPIHIELGDLNEDQPLFLFDEHDKLIGARHEWGKMALRVDHEISLDEMDRLTFRIVPEVLREPRALARKLQGDDAAVDEGESFAALSCSLVLRPGQYVVIGPSSATRMVHLVGSAFLTSRDEDWVYENLYCVVPRIYRWAPFSDDPDRASQQGSRDE